MHLPPPRRQFDHSAIILSALALILINPAPVKAENAAFASCLTFDRPACDAVLAAEPENLTALFMRGLAAELDGDNAAALADFDAAATREPRHFGAQLWRHVAALTRHESRAAELEAYLLEAKQLPPWPRALADLYLAKTSPAETLGLAQAQPATSRAEAICAAQYHIGRHAGLSGRTDEAMEHFRAALATGAEHVFEYQAAKRALAGLP